MDYHDKKIITSGSWQRCPSRLKTCRCRTAAFEKKATAPLPRRDGLLKKSHRAAAATVYKNKLPRRCRDDFFKNLPLPRWFLKKFSEFHCCDCIGPEILVLVQQIHLVSGCFICKH
jgi:hypothetical protein